MWNLWHGCHKVSEGCRNCYVYRGDSRRGVDSSKVVRTTNFDLPLKKNRKGEYKIPSGQTAYTCFTSDFLVEQADQWRNEAWEMMKIRSDIRFMFITKRIDRLLECLPADWGDGYENVEICCTVENQQMADKRLPIYVHSPIKHKTVICEPLLGPIDLSEYLTSEIKQVVVGGESGYYARPCDYDWVLSLRQQCEDAGIGFWFKQTGAYFVRDGKTYKVPRRLQHSQARKAGLNIKV